MAAHDGTQHSEPQGSLLSEPEFQELCRIAQRLTVERRDLLYDILWADKLDRINDEFNHALRLFDYADAELDRRVKNSD